MQDQVVILRARGIGEYLELVEPILDLIAELEGEMGTIAIEIAIPAESKESAQHKRSKVARQRFKVDDCR